MPGTLMRMENDLKELGENTVGKLKEAITQGNQELSLALADILFSEGEMTAFQWNFANLDWIARNYGEEEVPKALRRAGEILQRGQLSAFTGITALDYVKLYAGFMRALRSGPAEMGDIKIREEKDRWVMAFDPCGSGGRIARGPKDGSGSRLKPPFSMGKTTRKYPWAWGRVGIPYFCAHCCVWSEIMAIEQNGYPSRVTECPADDPLKPCQWYVYKDPNLIPEEYFNRVGFKKEVSRFKRGHEKKWL